MAETTRIALSALSILLLAAIALRATDSIPLQADYDGRLVAAVNAGDGRPWAAPNGGPVQRASEDAREILDRAIADFLAGRVPSAVTSFDRVAALVPGAAPQLWQRGIALYYVSRYADCRAQFESHRTVNPDDVENAAWHFLCVARAESPERARAALLPVGPDSRVPMREVYQMFRGALAPDAVLAAAGTGASAQFYAQLYVGLYYEAVGKTDLARTHITAAANDRFASAGGYMHSVAKVHRQVRTW